MTESSATNTLLKFRQVREKLCPIALKIPARPERTHNRAPPSQKDTYKENYEARHDQNIPNPMLTPDSRHPRVSKIHTN
jgi:hypothetical protein